MTSEIWALFQQTWEKCKEDKLIKAIGTPYLGGGGDHREGCLKLCLIWKDLTSFLSQNKKQMKDGTCLTPCIRETVTGH